MITAVCTGLAIGVGVVLIMVGFAKAAETILFAPQDDEEAKP